MTLIYKHSFFSSLCSISETKITSRILRATAFLWWILEMAGRTIAVVAPNMYAFKQLGKQLVALWETSCRCRKSAEGQKSSLKDRMYIKTHRCINRDPVKTERTGEEGYKNHFFFSSGGSCKIASYYSYLLVWIAASFGNARLEGASWVIVSGLLQSQVTMCETSSLEESKAPLSLCQYIPGATEHFLSENYDL